MNKVRNLGLLASSGTLALLAAACGSQASLASSHSSTSAPNTSPTVAATAATTSSTLAPTTTVAAASTAASGPACAPSDLAVSVVKGTYTMGNWGIVVGFRNSSNATCVVSGWPQVYGISTTGGQAEAKQTLNPLGGYPYYGMPMPTTEETVVLAPGAESYAEILGSDQNSSYTNTCQLNFKYFRVAPPGSTQFTQISAYDAPLDSYAYACNLPSATALFTPPASGSS